MKGYTRIYTGPDGTTHMEDVEVDLELDVILDGHIIASQSKPMKCAEPFFISGVKSAGWHCCPRKQFLIFLEGKMEMETGDGKRKTFLPGDVLLVEDTEGKGHLSRTKSWSALVVPIVNY